MQPKKFGLIGHPVGHSLSAVMQNRVFRELNLPHTYEAFDILPENLEQFIKGTDLSGANVTIPHKVEAMDLVDELDQSAKDIKAVNTIEFPSNRQPTTDNRPPIGIVGHNTDSYGFSHSLEEEDIILEEKNVLVIGAGGASRAILVSLINNKANVTLTNRTKQKAEDLVKELSLQDQVEIVDYQLLTTNNQLPEVDIIVNTTSLGMTPKVETTPIPKDLLKPNHIIFDVVYNPLETQLIKDAKSIGCKTISGVNMLVHQGAQSLRIWLGIEPPTEIMKEVVLESLI